LPSNVIPGRSEGPSPEPKHTGIADMVCRPVFMGSGFAGRAAPRNDRVFIFLHTLESRDPFFRGPELSSKGYGLPAIVGACRGEMGRPRLSPVEPVEELVPLSALGMAKAAMYEAMRE